MVVSDKNVRHRAGRWQCPTCQCCPRARRDVGRCLTGESPNAFAARREYRVELKIDVGQTAVIVGETTLKVER